MEDVIMQYLAAIINDKRKQMLYSKNSRRPHQCLVPQDMKMLSKTDVICVYVCRRSLISFANIIDKVRYNCAI